MSSSKPKLLIIELDHHAEVLAAICPVLSERFRLILWSTEKVWKRAGLDESLFDDLIIAPKKMSLHKVWRNHEQIISSAELIYFNTIERNTTFFYSAKFPCPIIIRIHNVNASLFPLSSVDWSLSKLPKILAYFIRKTFLYDTWGKRKRLFMGADLLMLPSLLIAKKVQGRLALLGFNNIADYCLPFFSLGASQRVVEGKEEVVIGVTGSIDPNRKEYNDLLAAVEIFNQSQPKKQLRIIFLGAPKGRAGLSIMERFKSLENEYFNIEYSLGYIPQEDVLKKLQKVQFLVAPIRFRSLHKIHKEYYGETKISGIECDIVNFRKPAILPRGYLMPESLQSVTRHYDSPESLYLSIVHYGIDQQYKSAAGVFEAMDLYRREKIAEDFYQLYQSIVPCDSP